MLPQTPAGKLHFALEMIELYDSMVWYKKLFYRVKYGKEWKIKLFLKGIL